MTIEIDDKTVEMEENSAQEDGKTVLEENAPIQIDPKEKEVVNEPLDAKKSFRITQSNKEKIDLLEAEVKPANANAFFEQLINALIEVRNAEGAIYTQDYRVELLDNLTRIVEVFDQIERRNSSKNNILMSRYTDQIKALHNTVEALKQENEELKKSNQTKISELTSKHVVAISELQVDKNKVESELMEAKERKNNLETELEEVKKSLEETTTELTKKTKLLADIKTTDSTKDSTINELTATNKKLTEDISSAKSDLSTLEVEKGKLETKVSNLEEQLEQAKKFQEQQKTLYETQIATYSSLLASQK